MVWLTCLQYSWISWTETVLRQICNSLYCRRTDLLKGERRSPRASATAATTSEERATVCQGIQVFLIYTRDANLGHEETEKGINLDSAKMVVFKNYATHETPRQLYIHKRNNTIHRSTTYHLQMKRTIQTLEDMLKACITNFANNWEHQLLLVEFSYKWQFPR